MDMNKTTPRRSARAGNGPSNRSGVPRRSNAVLEKPAQPATKRGRATRQRPKDALSRQLQDHPFHQIRLEAITREAGVRVSLLYHYLDRTSGVSGRGESVRVAIGGRRTIKQKHTN